MNRRARSWLTALTLGLLGGALFWQLRMPLAWMLGAMFATTVAALAGIDVAVPKRLNNSMTIVLGLVLGCGFTQGFFAAAQHWALTLVTMCAYVALVTAVLTWWYRRLGMGPTTAYFAAAPGGLNLMVAVGSAYGGDDRVLALVHALRILLVVASVPLWYRFTGGYQPAQAARLSIHLWQVGAVDALVLAASAALGVVGGRLARLPAPGLTGPMFLSAALHVAGLSAVRPPIELVFLAQFVIGSALGCRFAGVRLRELLMPVAAGLGGTAVMLGGAIAVSHAIAAVNGLPADEIMLAFTPGGLAEMSLLALALGMDVAFVSTHHFVRVLLVMMLVPAAFRLMRRGRESGAQG